MENLIQRGYFYLQEYNNSQQCSLFIDMEGIFNLFNGMQQGTHPLESTGQSW